MADTDQDPTTVLARSVSVPLSYQLQYSVANLILSSQSCPYFTFQIRVPDRGRGDLVPEPVLPPVRQLHAHPLHAGDTRRAQRGHRDPGA